MITAELERSEATKSSAARMKRRNEAERRLQALKDDLEHRVQLETETLGFQRAFPEVFEPEWPEADVVIGNPPFLGGKLLIPACAGAPRSD